MLKKINLKKKKNIYVLIYHFFMVSNFALNVTNWQLSMQFSKHDINKPYKIYNNTNPIL